MRFKFIAWIFPKWWCIIAITLNSSKSITFNWACIILCHANYCRIFCTFSGRNVLFICNTRKCSFCIFFSPGICCITLIIKEFCFIRTMIRSWSKSSITFMWLSFTDISILKRTTCTFHCYFLSDLTFRSFIC